MSIPLVAETTVLSDTSCEDSGTSHDNRATSGVSPKLFRACTNCVRAETKCVPSINVGEKCQRCKQGKQNCQPSSPVRKRRTEARHPANKVGKLEEKLDGLVALLKSATSGTPEHSETTPVSSGSNFSSRISIIDSSAASGLRYGGNTSTQLLRTGNSSLDSSLIPAATSTSDFESTGLPSLIHPALEPSPEDAESYLNRVRTDFIKHLAFIVIAPAISAQQLRHTSPGCLIPDICIKS